MLRKACYGSDEDGKAKGIKVGVLKLLTIWPFADKEVKEVLSKVKKAIVPEMNLASLGLK